MRLTGSVHIGKDTDLLYDDLAMAMFGVAAAAVKQRGVFHVALSGGSTPEPFYIRLVTDPRFRGLPWQDTHVWIVDERRVPEDHEKSNYKMIRETLIDHVPMRKRNAHPMPVMEADPAALYERQLASAFGVKAPEAPPPEHVHAGLPPQLDFVLLGMGDDTHTASLFPGSPALDEQRRWVAVNEGPKVTPPDRVTMTYPLLNAARHIAVLVTGAKKRLALGLVEKQLAIGPDPHRYPITGVAPASASGSGQLTWYLDPAAAGSGLP